MAVFFPSLESSGRALWRKDNHHQRLPLDGQKTTPAPSLCQALCFMYFSHMWRMTSRLVGGSERESLFITGRQGMAWHALSGGRLTPQTTKRRIGIHTRRKLHVENRDIRPRHGKRPCLSTFWHRWWVLFACLLRKPNPDSRLPNAGHLTPRAARPAMEGRRTPRIQMCQIDAHLA
jgi:hypothetical protein